MTETEQLLVVKPALENEHRLCKYQENYGACPRAIAAITIAERLLLLPCRGNAAVMSRFTSIGFKSYS